ncbi:carbohydrate ABC transporter permease (plasmid) [Streptomyces sp. BI20]|uniref:carbohydrate ABC transporter permease n=1 Tax=Streptomyces sp. BI20 TaxID=3403460 RepID=UPI003C706E14
MTSTLAPGRSGGRARGPASDRPTAPKPPPDTPLDRSRQRVFWLFVLPAVLLFLLFFVAPVLFSVWLSFHRWDGVGPMEFRGLDTWAQLLRDDTFLTALRNTGLILVVGGACTFVISFGITLFLREMAGRKLIRYVLFFPVLVNPLVFGVMTGLLFRPDGVVNAFLSLVGVDSPPKWLGVDNLFPMILGTLVWASVGFYTTLLMSGVEQIPRFYYEAAELDGAGAWHRFRHITLPLSWEVVTVCAVLWTIASIKVFELVLVFGGSTGGQPPTSTYTTALHVYQSAFATRTERDFGIASAAAVASLVLIALVAGLLRRLMRRETIHL